MIIVFVLINCLGGYEKQVLSDLKELTDEVQGTFGIFDFVSKIHGSNLQAIEDILEKIRKIPHVTHTNTIHTIPEQNKE